MRFPASPTLRNRSGRLPRGRYARTPAAGGGGGGGFNLGDLSPLAWYDFSETGTLDIDVGISGVADLSGNGNDLEQLTGSLQPATGGDIGGLNAAVFNADTLSLSTEINTMRAAFVVVDNCTGSDASTQVAPLFGAVAANTDHGWLRTNASDYTVSLDGNVSNTGRAAYNGNAPVSGANINLGVSSANKSGPLALYFEWDAAVDVGLIGEILSFGSYKLKGEIGEAAIYDTVPSDEDRAAAFEHLREKWSLY